MIGDVEGLGTNLEAQMFPEGNLLCNDEIDIRQSGSDYGVLADVSKRTGSRLSKGRRVEEAAGAAFRRGKSGGCAGNGVGPDKYAARSSADVCRVALEVNCEREAGLHAEDGRQLNSSQYPPG